MNKRDYIGQRGEALFLFMITDWCGKDEPWFQAVHLGEKYQTKDFLVDLVNPASGQANFYVQVKTTKGTYSGKGQKRKLKVRVSKASMKKLKKVPAPVFVVGIDIETRMGYVVQITEETADSISGIALTHPLNCTQIKKIWEWVNNYWGNKSMLPEKSAFS
jgi:phenylpyruvate tautomerase PptA (4-oxalocrotonate tautomerase family)